MKVTQVLWRQHLGRMTKRHWWGSSKVVLRDMPTEKCLEPLGIKIEDAKAFLNPVKVFPKLQFPRLFPLPLPRDNTHPEWNDRPRLQYGTDNLLQEGVDQAQVLLNAVHKEGLPKELEASEDEQTTEIHDLISRFIQSSHIFDATQVKLPKIKDPLRPGFNFARVYGIPDVRKMHNLIQKMLQLCEIISDPLIGQQRQIVHDGHVRTYIERGDDLLYFESEFDTMLLSNKSITPMTCDDSKHSPLPDISPLFPTIGLQEEHIYDVQDHYPVSKDSKWMNAHTIFVNYDSEKVKNKTELPQSDTQVFARAMLKSFATAACCAKQKFGDHVVDLPEPITIQCVHSNGQWFDFSVFQLNTLNLVGEEGTKNIWWSAPRILLYSKAGYVSGIPHLEGYNPDVFNKILAFYRNV